MAGLLIVALACSIGLPSLPAYAEESAPDGGDYPAAYDLRDVDGHCYVTPVKFQNPFGTCWGFAAIAAAETSVLGSHFEDDPLAYKSLDFSEKQLCYFSQYHLDDPANSQNTEGVYSLKYDMGDDGSFYLKEPETAQDHYTGGTLFLATSMLASGAGPTLESKSDALVYKGKEGKTINFEDETPYCYSYDDDWTLGAEYRFMQDYVLKESYMLPSPAAFWSNPETSEGGYLYDEEGTKAIKDQLMQKRGVSISFHADTSLPWDTGYGLYMDTTTWAHYTHDDSMPNHGVTIIGWDDNYPASNFTHDVYERADPSKEYDPSNFKTDESGNYVVDEKTTALTTPPADGAWLVKNSWGSGEEEFPNNGGGDWGIPVQKTDDFGNPVFDENGNPVMVGSGYFWLSYYDWSLDRPEAFVFDTALTAPGSIYDQETDEGGSLAFAAGRLFFVKCHSYPDDDFEKAYVYIRSFSEDFQTLGDPVRLDHPYSSSTIKDSPRVATVGSSLYILGVVSRVNDMEFAVDQLMGLQRVNVAADGSITCTDLSDTLSGLERDIKAAGICMAASNEGVFLISGHENMKALLPDGAAPTDTFILKDGASSFEPYAKTLSFAPFTNPVAVCSNGWLYAFAVSNYESTTIFGRATKVAEEKPDEPDTPDQPDTPTKPDQPDTPTKPSESGKQVSGSSVAKTSRTTLAKTGDPMAYLMTATTLLAAFGLASIVLGLRRRNRW